MIRRIAPLAAALVAALWTAAAAAQAWPTKPIRSIAPWRSLLRPTSDCWHSLTRESFTRSSLGSTAKLSLPRLTPRKKALSTP